MAKQLSKGKEAVPLLRLLLTSDQEHRQLLARTLHEKKTLLTALNLQLDLLARNSKQFKKNDGLTIPAIREILNKILDDLAPVNYGMSPMLVYVVGLGTPLRSLARKYKDHNKVEIYVECPDMERSSIPKGTQAGIYRICDNIVEFLFRTGCKKLTLSVTRKRDFLNVSIIGRPPHQKGIHGVELTKKLDLIKALLIWQSAFVNISTDWIYSFDFKFKIEK